MQLMKDRGLLTSKIVSVRGDSDILLENGDYLGETDLVKIIPQEESSRTPSFRQMNEHVFIVGHARTPVQVCSPKEIRCELQHDRLVKYVIIIGQCREG